MRVFRRWTHFPGYRCDACGCEKFFEYLNEEEARALVSRGSAMCANIDCTNGRMRTVDTTTERSGFSIAQRSPHQNVLLDLPENAAERKNIPICTGFLDYFPLAAAYVARVSKAGNDQHNPGQPLHWSRGKSSDHADCIARHLMQRGTFDVDVFPGTDERIRHTGKLAWRAMALLQEELEAAAGFDPNAVAAEGE